MAFGSESDDSDVRAATLATQESPKLAIPSPSKSTNRSKPTGTTSSKPSKSLKPYICDIDNCGLSFSRPWRLNAHKCRHTGQKPYHCDVAGCNKSYTSSFHLRRHKANSHSSPKQTTNLYCCEFPGCGLLLKTKQNERKHYKRTHEPKRFSCTSCPLSFSKHSQLKAHIYEHTGEPPFKCKTCGLGFVKQFELKRHERGHRVHLCPYAGCLEAFPTWSLVRKHLVKHPPDFNCHYCAKGYRNREHFKSHIARHLLTTGNAKQLKCTEKKKQFKCSICSKEFAYKVTLKRHISNIHLSERKEKQPPKQKRATRKDKGVPKHCFASVLADVPVPRHIEKALINNQVESGTDDELVKMIVIDRLKADGQLESESCFSTSEADATDTETRELEIPPRL